MAPLPDLQVWDSLDPHIARHIRERPPNHDSATLDLGCGDTPRNPFRASSMHGIDIRDDPARNVRYADLVVEPVPHPDATFDYVTAFDFIEHVPRVAYLPARRFPFVELMNEIWRVLKPGGIFLSVTPAYPSSEAFRDPTHVNIITCETFPLYFDCKSRLASMYGFRGYFEVVEQASLENTLVSVLRKTTADRVT